MIFVALTSSRGDGRPQDAAIGTLNRLSAAEPADPGNNDGHRLWWDRFWRRSFIELPDKLMENMWYFGAYLQASFSRSLEASGFFGPWHPLDHRTWLDCHTADAQTALLWWAPFATNHMELMLPSHNTFAGLLPFFMAFNPGKGALVPHQFAPAWAGGAAFFGRPNPYKGSIAWFALNFWNDFLLTRDRKFLSGIAYPVIAACADFHAADLVRGRDGLLHCRNSSSPEQADTANDNVYDRACIGAVLRAAVSAAGILGAEPRRARRWEDALRDLYDFPADTASLIETKDNPHPYRCHPTVLFGIHPTGEIEPGSPLWKKADETYGIVTNLFGFHYEDRHNAIPGHRGGQEPNGHATAFLMHAAARLRGWREVRRLFYALTVRTQLKPNGQLSICDPRHDRRLTNMAICEATSGQTSGITEALLQNYSDHARVFPNMNSGGVFRFAGLRARGGFILAGERARGRTNFLVVHSLCGGKLRLLNPWPGRKPLADPAAPMALARLADGNEALEISTTPGSTFRISCGEPGRAPAPAVENRRGPRAVVCGDWTDYSPPVVYYPEDLPFAQETGGARVFLGRPAAKPRPRRDAPASWARITAMTRDKEWQARQTAARWLAAVPSERAIKLLIKMARRDPKPVVRYTAGVSLVRHSSPAGLRAALAIARATGALPHLRREIEKAINRRSRRLSLNTDSVWRARDCSGAINRETKRRST